MNEDRHPHVNTWQCGRCRKDIEEGHRICRTYIAHGKGRDPMNVMNIGLMLSDEFEFVHIDCHDPCLHKGLKD